MGLYSKLREIFDEKIAIQLGEAIEEELSILQKIVTKEEFNNLKQIVSELVQAQKGAEERLTRLEKAVEELAEAQKKTEQRVNELAEAQKKTEQRVNELAEAQKKTEQRVNELAEAQKKTEEEIRKLSKSIKELNIRVGGITESLGHPLEDKAIVKLPSILKEKFNIKLFEGLKRDYLENLYGKMEEVNFFGFGERNGEKIFIIGEGKARFGIGDLKDFEEKLKRFGKKYGEPFPIVVTYIFSKPEIKDKLKNKGINCFLSYELDQS